eukprot:gene7065-9644_t
MLYFCIFLFALLWFLAVFKVFILDDGIDYPVHGGNEKGQLLVVSNSIQKPAVIKALPSSIQRRSEKRVYATHKDSLKKQIVQDISSSIRIPLASEWVFIRSSLDYKVEENDKHKLFRPNDLELNSEQLLIAKGEESTGSKKSIDKPIIVMDGNSAALPTKSSTELAWPPMNTDFTIPTADGYEIMPITGLKVPRFWSAPSNVDNLNTVGSRINGEETIFLMIASYRDFQCRETITSAFKRSDHPERLFVAAVDQLVPGDIGCLDIDIPCSVDPDQPICKYRSQISIFKMDAQYATGPVTARHVGDRMYRGEYFVMQMDAHCLFVNHWDTKIIDQWRQTHNEMAVLSSYLTDVQGSIDKNGDSTRKTRPIMCNSDFEGMMPARYLRHGAQPEDFPEIHDMPQMQPFWAAGFSFSRGHFKMRVPYDAYQPMVFQGEEIGIGIRGFTWGYDFYAPRDSVVFHEYAEKSSRRKKIHMFWENSGHAGEGVKSMKRNTAVIGMAPDLDPSTWDHRETDKYGLGKERPLDLFYKLFLIDPQKRKATQLCPFVKSGLMHRDFQPFLRPDGNGIDYSHLLEYDTQASLDKHLTGQHPYWERVLQSSIDNRDMESLKEGIDSAIAIGLDKKNLEIVQLAKSVLEQIKSGV